MLKKVITLLISLFVLILACPIKVKAEELKAPVVQFKLVNHDEIALRWNEIEGVDYYRIYRTDVGTGKTVRYKNPIKKTEVTVKGLSAETEYIFNVAAVSEKDDEVIVEAKSRGTYVTTPKEWYYSYSATSNEHYWTYKYFKENYSKTIHTDIILKDIKYVDEFTYSDGWIYFISRNSGGGYYVGRIREDGSSKEILFDDFGTGDGWSYNSKVYEDYIYLYREYTEYEITYISDFHKISLKTGEVTKLCDVFSSFYFDVKDDYIYYVYYQEEYNPKTKGYLFINNNNNTYLCKMKTDGTEKQIICPKLKKYGTMYIYENEVFFWGDYFFKISSNGEDIQEIFNCNDLDKIINGISIWYINNFEIVNGYIYFTEYGSFDDRNKEINPIVYYRLKTDGTGLTKQKKPFEWRY